MQISKTQTIRMANVLGMDIENMQDQVGILDALSSVSNPDSFIEWMRDNRDTVDFANRRDKLTVLHKRYKKTVDDIPTGVLQKFSKKLASQFKEAIVCLRDNEEYLTDHLDKLKVDGSALFSDKQIELLDATGKLNRLINLHDLGTLYDALYEASIRKTLIANKPALTDNQKRVKYLTGEIV